MELPLSNISEFGRGHQDPGAASEAGKHYDLSPPWSQEKAES